MAISVVCPGCKKRFQVSEKFAGQKGPCPNCKTVIQIPKKEDEVVIHEPEQFGPKGKSGQAVLKPILREETKVSPAMMAGALVGVAAVFFLALVLRGMEDKPLWLLGLGAVALGPPLAWAGYAFLRDDELEPYRGVSLWIRAGVCGAVYALIWGLFAFINWYLFESDPLELPMMVVIVPLMLVAGAAVATVSLDLDFFTSMFHYGLYLAATVLLRLTMGMAPLGPQVEQTAAALARWW